MFYVCYSEQLDAIALKKLVQFVNDLMQQYFSYVQRRVQLEVCQDQFIGNFLLKLLKTDQRC